MPTDQKVTGLSPVGVTGERESKRLSFLHLGSARRRRNGNPSRGGQDSHSGKGRSKKTEKPKTGKEARKPDTGTGRELENQAQKTGKAPKPDEVTGRKPEKRGCPTKSPPQAKITPVGDCSDRGEHVRPNSSDCLLYRQFRPPAGLLYRLRDKSRASTPSNVSRTGSIRSSASNVIRSMHTCR